MLTVLWLLYCDGFITMVSTLGSYITSRSTFDDRKFEAILILCATWLDLMLEMRWAGDRSRNWPISDFHRFVKLQSLLLPDRPGIGVNSSRVTYQPLQMLCRRSPELRIPRGHGVAQNVCWKGGQARGQVGNVRRG